MTRRAGEAFVIISADDWEREQETLHVLQNQDLIGADARPRALKSSFSSETLIGVSI
ncbi:type II toxin-antitoxin system Phd/YefM family antitoxin [Vreelandella venusta]|uniref:type II toxin-antitoxin system Phd/YefM family antitoxin n=1 Tax=Vreelandella venusta TaxID=44935 RepID=UPI003F68139A